MVCLCELDANVCMKAKAHHSCLSFAPFSFSHLAGGIWYRLTEECVSGELIDLCLCVPSELHKIL